MIKTVDTYDVYNRQITHGQDEIKYLEFALMQFREDEFASCIIKQNSRTGKYAVFIKGIPNVSLKDQEYYKTVVGEEEMS